MSFGGGFNNQWPNNNANNVNPLALASSLIAAAINLNTVGNQGHQGLQGPPNQMNFGGRQGGPVNNGQFQNNFSQGRRGGGGGGILAPWAVERGQMAEPPQNFRHDSFGPVSHQQQQQYLQRQQQRRPLSNPGRGGQSFSQRGPTRGNLASGKGMLANKQQEQPKEPPKKVEAKKGDPKKEATPQRQTSPVKTLKEAEKKETVSAKPATDGSKADLDESKDEIVEEEDKSAYAGLPKELLKCVVCDKDMWNGPSFERHLKGRHHIDMMEHLADEHSQFVGLLRHHVKLLEARKPGSRLGGGGKGKKPGKIEQSSMCNMCDHLITGPIIFHRKTLAHIRLKEFLHPKCKYCGMKEFQIRSDWDEHRFSAGHLHAMFKQGLTKLPVEPEYYTLFTMAEDGKESNDGGEKSSKTESDKVAEIEAKQLEDDKIVDYDIPAFEDSKPVGLSYLKNVHGHWCPLCKKFLQESHDLSEHCRTKQHYDKFVESVEQRKAKAEKAYSSGKRYLSDSVAGVDDDSGNWKRQRVANADSDDDEGMD